MVSVNKATRKQKILFAFLLVVGNAIMALMNTPNSGASPRTEPSSSIRPDYVNIRITGELKAELNPQKPVMLLGKDTLSITKAVFLIKRYKAKVGPESFLKSKEGEDFLVSVPKGSAARLLGNEVFSIYPNELEIKNKKRRSYELVY